MFVRLILLLAFVVIAVIAVTSLLNAVKTVQGPNKGDTMPQTFQRIAYVLLIVFMFGICTGWLGAI